VTAHLEWNNIEILLNMYALMAAARTQV